MKLSAGPAVVPRESIACTTKIPKAIICDALGPVIDVGHAIARDLME